MPSIQDGGSLSAFLLYALVLRGFDTSFLLLLKHKTVGGAAEEYEIFQWLSNVFEYPTESILRRLFNYCINWSLLLQPTVILESPFLKLKKS